MSFPYLSALLWYNKFFIQGLESYTVRKSKSVHNKSAFPESSLELLGQNSKINVHDRDSGDWTRDINSVQQTLAG